MSLRNSCRVLLAATFLLAITACHNHREGPGEHAGRKIDEGLSKAGEKMESAGEKLQDKAHGD